MDWAQLGAVAAITFVACMGVMVALWLLSIPLRDVSIVDLWWGPGFPFIAWIAYALAGQPGPRDAVVAALATLWGLRLALMLGRRKIGHGEDRRYAAFRKRVATGFNLFALKNVFLLQGAVMWLVSTPLLLAIVQPAATQPFGVLGWIGAAVFTLGFLCEAVGDWQMDRFRANPANRGLVMDRGLWRYTRHPNYFGDACVWLGFALIACDHWTGLLGLLSPVAMAYFLVRVTGAPILERYLVKSKPGYAAYAARTSPFVPWPPKDGPTA